MNKQIIATFLTSMTALSGVTYMIMNNNSQQLRNADDVSSNEVYAAWLAWFSEYRQYYIYDMELNMHYAAFTANYKWIQTFNKQGHNFTVGLNQFAIYTNPEFAALQQGQLIFNDKPKNYVELTGAIPDSINWVEKGAVTPVIDQGQCGCCWAFSTAGSLEGLNFITNGKLLTFSEQQLIDCSSSYGNQGCNGGLMNNAFEYTANQGIELESTYPYIGETGTCQHNTTDVKFKNKGHADVKTKDPEALQQAVARQPVSIAIEADQLSFQFYSSGIYDSADCGTSLDHGVLAVGYGVSASTKYWIVKNSWGTTWGNKGYIWIENQTGAGVCGINLEASYPTV